MVICPPGLWFKDGFEVVSDVDDELNDTPSDTPKHSFLGVFGSINVVLFVW